MVYKIIVFSPLVGFLLAGLFGKAIGTRGVETITTLLVTISAILSWYMFFVVAYFSQNTSVIELFSWIDSGLFQANWSLYIDTLTVVMLVVVNTVSALVHFYSIGYMHEDAHRSRFFAYLSLFTFAMLMLVTSDNLLQMFFGWEGVGLASYLLIGFWYKKSSANSAAMKAFIVNRVGDFGFALGIFGLYILFESVEFSVIFADIAEYSKQKSLVSGESLLDILGYSLNRGQALTVICLLLFMGAMGKSAQFLLHTWLPDAMEGPTPVSALIHAATMVTAGVFLLARMSPVFEQAPFALLFITIIGATTAFFAATVGLVQNDIKRVIAYSTCSQLGYMFAALGVGAYGAAIFHLFTHAFFKALLFLGAGCVIHAVGNEQDMRNMGGLKSSIPKTYWMMIIGTLALTGVGIPGTGIGMAGSLSKDAIIESVYMGNNIATGYAFTLLVISALFTSFYSWRLIFMTFHGKSRSFVGVTSSTHEAPKTMLIPLYILAFGSVATGFLFYNSFLGHNISSDNGFWYNDFWREALYASADNSVLKDFHYAPWLVKFSPVIMMFFGFLIAWYCYIYNPKISAIFAKQHRFLYQFLLNKWYFDEVYNYLFVRPIKSIGYFLWKTGDKKIIDGIGPDGISAYVIKITKLVSSIQTGLIYHYAFSILIGFALLITWVMFRGIY